MLFVSVLALVLSASPGGTPESSDRSWLTDPEVERFERDERVLSAIERLADEELRAGRWLPAAALAETCLSLDRYRCSCLKAYGFGYGKMKSADEASRRAALVFAGPMLMDYGLCAETAADAASVFATGAKWAGSDRTFSGEPADSLDAKSSPALLGEGNRHFTDPFPYFARTRFEACAGREPVNCGCVRRLGDLWSSQGQPRKALVWWYRSIDCDPSASQVPVVRREIEAARNALRDRDDEGPIRFSGPLVTVRPGLGKLRLDAGRASIQAKRLEDAVLDFKVCILVTTENESCKFELAKTLDRLERFREAQELWSDLSHDLPATDARRKLARERVARYHQ